MQKNMNLLKIVWAQPWGEERACYVLGQRNRSKQTSPGMKNDSNSDILMEIFPISKNQQDLHQPISSLTCSSSWLMSAFPAVRPTELPGFA
jgi:hypothetical protein